MQVPQTPKPEPGLYFEKAPSALIAVNTANLQFIAANESALNLLGAEAADVAGLNLSAMVAASDLERISGCLHSPDNDVGIQNCVIRDSADVVHEFDIVAHRKAGESTQLLLIQASSPRNGWPEQSRQAQKMEAMGMLAGGIAHDFNNLLTIIAGYSQMLQTSSHMKTERDRTAVEQVLKACERAAALTAQLLSFSRRQISQPKVVDVNMIVDQTAAMLLRLIGEDIDLQVRKAPDAGRTYADEGLIQQLLLNLAINSRDAMPDGGTLLIETKNVELSPEYIGQNFPVKPGTYVGIQVSDTGTGMDEATRKRVFEPFFTTREPGKGTGLGLSTVYSIVRQCGGSIDLYSEPSHGTTLNVYLPRVQEAATAEREAPRRPKGGHETLLLVEDEENVRLMVRAALERSGYRVLVAAGGPEALVLAAAHEGPIDLLISDMVMPKMNGRELARRLLEERPRIAVLFVSGYPDTTFEIPAGQKPPEFLQKPFAPIDLTARVRQILDALKSGNDAARTAGTNPPVPAV